MCSNGADLGLKNIHYDDNGQHGSSGGGGDDGNDEKDAKSFVEEIAIPGFILDINNIFPLVETNLIKPLLLFPQTNYKPTALLYIIYIIYVVVSHLCNKTSILLVYVSTRAEIILAMFVYTVRKMLSFIN